MARRKSNTSATGANMDSLLDALTNVVGILVIVLVAVQLSSQEAAQRMEEMIAQIDPAEQERIKQAAKDSEEKLEEMKLALQEESEKDEIDPDKLLAMLQDDIAAAEVKAKKDLLAAEAAEKEAEKKMAEKKLGDAMGWDNHLRSTVALMAKTSGGLTRSSLTPSIKLPHYLQKSLNACAEPDARTPLSKTTRCLVQHMQHSGRS